MLMIAFPGSLFFQFAYSESLFLFLLMGLWWALRRQRHGLAWIMAFLLPLTRAIGVFCILPILWQISREAASASLKRHPSWRPLMQKLGLVDAPSADGNSAAPPLPANSAVHWPLPLAPLCGWLVYLAIMYAGTGNAFEGFAAQKFWGVNSVGNLWDVGGFVRAYFTPIGWHGFTGSLLDRAIFLLLICCIPALWRMDKGLLVWTYALGIVPAMSATFTSFTRYAAVAFPMFIALAVLLAHREWRWFRYFLILAFGVLHAKLVWNYVNFQWAG